MSNQFSEQMSAMAKYAGSGAAIGSFGGPLGSFIGAGLGLVVGAVVGGLNYNSKQKQEGLEYKQLYLDAMGAESDTKSLIEQTNLQIQNAQTNISGIEQTLANWNTTTGIQLDQFKQQGTSQFNQLMSNFANTQVSASAKGQIGGSSAIMSDIAKQNVVDFAGSDLTLNNKGGGTFAKIMEQTKMNLSDEYQSQLLGKQDLFSAIENYRVSNKQNQTTLITQQSLKKDYKSEMEKRGVKIN